ncbi:Uncharacterized protein FWK35_00031308 [Aphis craccivora]|uniref:Uncharacterized protein n=1 Tax=Aphis craccivora TaxID=307492 RepID=A0A6G0VQI2_APHCR|nr:Uncharacterized protein FWK35_00031308 [Aphis craccivora]
MKLNIRCKYFVTGIPKTEKENCVEIIKKIGEINNVNIIIAKLEKDMRLELIRKTKINKLKPNMLLSHWPENQIYINEHLTKKKRILFAQTRLATKEKNYKFTWINNTNKEGRKFKDILLKNNILNHLPELECLNNAFNNNIHIIITSESWLGPNFSHNYLPFKYINIKLYPQITTFVKAMNKLTQNIL